MSELTIVGAFIAGTVFGGAVTIAILITLTNQVAKEVPMGNSNHE